MSQAPHSGSLSDSSIYSDFEQHLAFDDEAFSLSGEDWDEISEDSASSLSVVSAISEIDGPRIVPVRALRRRGSAPELGNSTNWEEIHINTERNSRVGGRQRPIEEGRLSFFGYDATKPDGPSRLRREMREAEYPRQSLSDFDTFTRLDPTPNALAGKYPTGILIPIHCQHLL